MENTIDDENNQFFDPELEDILKSTAEISVTDSNMIASVQSVQQLQNPIRKQYNDKNLSKVETTIKEILSRKDKINLKSNINLKVFDKKTFKFILDLFEKDSSQEEIIDIIINNLDLEEVKNSIRLILFDYYNKPTK